VEEAPYRVAFFGLPRAPGDSQDLALVVTAFPGGVGSVAANLQRWKGQLAETLHSAERSFERHGWQFTVLELEGKFDAAVSMQRPEERLQVNDFAGIYVLIDGPDTSWSLKFTGSRRSLTPHRAAIEATLASFAPAEPGR
jgi:hypothetical protein